MQVCAQIFLISYIMIKHLDCDAPAQPSCFCWRRIGSASGHQSCQGLMQVCQSTDLLEFLHKGKKEDLLAFEFVVNIVLQSVWVLRNGKLYVVIVDHNNAALYLKLLRKQSDRSFAQNRHQKSSMGGLCACAGELEVHAGGGLTL